MDFCTIASGSSGNCTYAGTGRTAVLVDAGISGKRIEQGLYSLDRRPEEISAMAQETSRFLPALIQEYARKLNVRPARVTVRNQKTRWGSCSSQGGLNFNCLLAQAPEYVRRYVVIHELCHLREMNHSPAFWHLVASQMPDYPKAKEWLKMYGQLLIDRIK